MPQPKPMLAVLITLVALGFTSALAAAEYGPGSNSGLSKSKTAPTKVQKINSAIHRSRSDRSFTFFVVCLPEDNLAAKANHSVWKGAVEKIHKNKSAVYFVRGDDAKEMLRKTSSPEAPICIAFRNGQPYHSRTGRLEPDVLDEFLDIAFNNSMPQTLSSYQVGALYDEYARLVRSGKQASAVGVACGLLLLTEGYMQSEHFAPSYTPEDMVRLNTHYHLTLLQLSMLNLKDPAVFRQIENTRKLAKAKWERNIEGNMGIGLWIDLTVALGKSQDIIDWVDAGVDSPRVTEGLRLAIGETLGLLAKHKRWRSLGLAIESPETIRGQMDGYKLSIELAQARKDREQRMEKVTREQLRESARCQASLLLIGRDKEAWEVAGILREHFPAQMLNAALCSAAIEVGVVSPEHAKLLSTLDPKKYAPLYREMNKDFALISADTE